MSEVFHPSLSRRDFFWTASGLLGALPLAAGAQSARRVSESRPSIAYVGTYSSPQGPEGSKGRGEGIYLFEMNPATGALTRHGVTADTSNPAWLALNKSKTRLYAANELPNFSASVSAFSIDRPSGRLTLLNTVSSGGAGPAHGSGRYRHVDSYCNRIAGKLLSQSPATAKPGTSS